MVIAGFNVTDADSLDAAADVLDEVENWITCPGCNGHKSITDYSPGLGWINIECPGCEGWGTILDTDPDDFDPEPPTPAAPAAVIPLYRCPTCRDTGRVAKPSAWFAGKATEGFCPDCTPHFDFATHGFVNCGTTAAPGEATPPAAPAPVPFDRHAHCQRIGQTGGLATYQRYGSSHYRAIGRAGYRVAVERHGVAYVDGLLKAKGWTGPHRPDLLSDLAAGRALAELDLAA
jgi:hypothetical protein